ncbi:alpha/beta fold hydrolase [Sinomonas mesophila]|uniref:alpha/beta fold hydrolase n=1 Tax=Sinomonas mesophila TaxID=1531955 RepID=UPI001C3793A6|nr:alpha/beta hydrolase [Sinomonas mesophila]
MRDTTGTAGMTSTAGMTRLNSTVLEQRSLELDGRRLAYAVRPGGPRTLCFVHGLGARWQTFRRLMAHIGPEWTVLAFDQRGHGQSSWTTGRYALADFAGDLVEFVRAVTSGPLVLYGHSLGGWVSALAAPRLADVLLGVGVEDSALYEPAAELQAEMEAFARPGAVMRSLNPSLRLADPGLEARWTERRAHAEQDPREMLAALPCPLLLVRGDTAAGGLLSAESAHRALRATAVPATEVFVAGSPHAVHAKEPGTVARAIADFATHLSTTGVERDVRRWPG